jgi:flavin-dependent dehydrogenase
LSFRAAARTDLDAIVVGAGPAGAVAAYVLARQGCSVLLVERSRFPRFKVCGGCISAVALGLLESVGLGALPRRLGATSFDHVVLRVGRGEARLRLPRGAVLSRERLDEALVAEARNAGAIVLQETTATGSFCEGDRRVVTMRSEEGSFDLAARVVLAADGLGGSFLREEFGRRASRRGAMALRGDGRARGRVGLGAVLEAAPVPLPDSGILMQCGTRGYVGLARREDGRINLGAAVDPAALHEAGPSRVIAGILADCGTRFAEELDAVAFRGTGPLSHSPERLSAERLYLIGDRAGYAEPFTGEGMAWAFAQGKEAAHRAIALGGTWSREEEAAWERFQRRHIARRHRVSRSLAFVLRHPKALRGVVAAVSRCSVLAAPVVGLIHRALPSTASSHRADLLGHDDCKRIL